MVLSSSDRKRASRLRKAEKRLRKVSQRSQSRSGGGGASANDEELARGFIGTASVDKRSHLEESESLGKAKVRRLRFYTFNRVPCTIHHIHKTQSQTTVTATTTTTTARLVQSSDETLGNTKVRLLVVSNFAPILLQF